MFYDMGTYKKMKREVFFMKKILSLTLAALMVVSMVPTAFAAEAGGNWAGGTAVDVTGEKTIEEVGEEG